MHDAETDPRSRMTRRSPTTGLAKLVAAVAGLLAGLGIGFIGNIMTGQPAWYLAALLGAPLGVFYASPRVRRR